MGTVVGTGMPAGRPPREVAAAAPAALARQVRKAVQGIAANATAVSQCFVSVLVNALRYS